MFETLACNQSRGPAMVGNTLVARGCPVREPQGPLATPCGCSKDGLTPKVQPFHFPDRGIVEAGNPE